MTIKTGDIVEYKWFTGLVVEDNINRMYEGMMGGIGVVLRALVNDKWALTLELKRESDLVKRLVKSPLTPVIFDEIIFKMNNDPKEFRQIVDTLYSKGFIYIDEPSDAERLRDSLYLDSIRNDEDEDEG